MVPRSPRLSVVSGRTAAASFTAACAVSVLVLTGCASPGSEAGSGPGGSEATLVYATGDAEPTCLDPHVGGNYPQALLSSQVLESLVSRDASGAMIPWLASSWETSADGLTWDFMLPEGKTFTDGTPVDAEAIRANIAHLQDPETGSSTGYLAVAQIASVEAVSPTQARFHLTRPDAALLESLAQPWNAIQSPAGIERGAEENCLAPIGTGPFVVSEWLPQDRIVLTRNDDFTRGPEDDSGSGVAGVATVEWRFIPDSATRFAALQSGDVDIIDNPLPEQIERAESDDALGHLDAPRPGASNRIELNSGKAPFDDARVREAFVAAADVDAGIASLFGDTAPRSTSALSSTEPLAVSFPEVYAGDAERANELLDEAGWTERNADGVRVKDGKTLTLEFPVSTNQSVPAEQALFEQIQAAAAGVGFEVRLSLLDLSSWYAALAEHNYNLVSAPYTKVGPDVLRFLFHSDSTVPAPSGYFANNAQVTLPELDAVLETLSRSSDAAERAAAATEAQRIVAEGHYLLPLYDQQNHFLFGAGVEGLRALPTVSTPVLARVTVQ